MTVLLPPQKIKGGGVGRRERERKEEQYFQMTYLNEL